MKLPHVRVPCPFGCCLDTDYCKRWSVVVGVLVGHGTSGRLNCFGSVYYGLIHNVFTFKEAYPLLHCGYVLGAEHILND